jgi:hypothetical protein
MSDQRTDMTGVKRATAILTTCLVQTLTESDPSFQERFVKRLERAYTEIRDQADMDELETLSWTRQLLTGSNFTAGQAKPLSE